MSRTKKEEPVTNAGNDLIKAAGIEPVENSNAGNGTTEGTNSEPGAAQQGPGAPPVIPQVIEGQSQPGPKVETLLTGDQQLENQGTTLEGSLQLTPGKEPQTDPRHGVVKQQRAGKAKEATSEDFLGSLVASVKDGDTSQLIAVKIAVENELATRNISDVKEPVKDPAETELEDKIKRFGEGYVDAVRGEDATTFTREAWTQLRGDRGGWKELVQTPPEVKALNK